jgi:long-chain acyl-CoA synthetase
MQVKRIFDLLAHYTENFPKSDALAAKVNGEWVKISTNEFVENVTLLSYGLLKLGIEKGDKIGIIANNRPEWNYVDLATLQVGAIDVPVYPTISESDLKYILKDAEVKYVFVSSKDLYDKVKRASIETSSILDIYTFNRIDGAKHWSEILELGKNFPDPEKLALIKSSIQDTELATLLYTSGTTGNPKGVMLSHKNLMSNVYAVRELPPTDEKGKALSFLPLNHVYERMLTYTYMYKGISIYYAESLDTIGDNLREIKPEVFSAVPRLLEKVYDKIMAKGNELKGIKKTIFFWSVHLGSQYDHYGRNGWWYELKLKIARKLVFSKWKEALGNNVKAAISGGAALNPRLCRIFWAAGVPILEGYGLTETSPVVAVNNFMPNSLRFGTVGPLLENVQVKFADDGEILVKGPNIMMGYYKRPDATKEVLTDGWFHTGDIGMLEENRFLKITDRKKEIFKTSGGKYIAPQMIENRLKESPFIEQAMIIGENQKFASALIVPAFSHLKAWASKNGINNAEENGELIKNPAVISKIKEEVEKVNKGLAQFESIKKFELLPSEWTIDKGELTPKMSLKRKVITQQNQTLIDKIYSNGK